MNAADSLCRYCHKYLDLDALPFVGIVTIVEASGQLWTFDAWLYHYANAHAWVPPSRFVSTVLEGSAKVVAARGPARIPSRGTRKKPMYLEFLWGSRVRFDTIPRTIDPLRFEAFLAALRNLLVDANAKKQTPSSTPPRSFT